MPRIGILTCSSATQDLGCSSVSCLKSMRERIGGFERYKEDDELDLVGIINCSGCPTVAGYEKILERVRGLVEFGVDAIHLTYCIDTLCPFKAKYVSILQEHFPEIEIVIGTHFSKLTQDQYREKVKNMLCQPRESMVDLIKAGLKK
ncbi:MAG: CGGC domain-containing protein [Nitrospira sp.]|nr:CGGC domain-containing protein [bacterium]MBL7048554.1 CGGC domain-containing protein [Nitrospira sp.]